jgi:hypothetical protein
LVKRQQRQSYVVQARKQLYLLMKSQFRYKTITCWLLLSLKDYYLDEKNRLLFTDLPTWMALLMIFPKLFYWDRTLWETALSLDQRINPTIYFIQND